MQQLEYDYDEVIIYCDPPYRGTAEYTDNGFNYKEFDEWVRKLKYDVKALKGVIFGIKTSEYDKCQIIKKILKNKKIGDDFQFWQAEYNDEKQTIEIREKLWKLKDFRGKVVSE